MKKILAFLKIIKNYNSLNKNKRIKSFYHLLFILITDKLFFNFLRIFNFKNSIIKKINKNEFNFAARGMKVDFKNEVIKRVERFNTIKDLNEFQNSKLSELRAKGYTELGVFFTKEECISFINALTNKKYYNSQVPLQSSGKQFEFKGVELEKKDYKKKSYFCFTPDQFMDHQVLKKLSNSEAINKIINAYLGFKSNIYSAITWFNKKSDENHHVETLHRDYDDFKFLVLFIYWTDVDKLNGATKFIPSSHLTDQINKSVKEVYLEGKQGTIFLADTSALHSGTKIISENHRIISWLRYGSLVNSATLQDGFTITPSEGLNKVF